MTEAAHTIDTTAKLVRMANQIARNLAHDHDPVGAVASHIHAFWTVRMQQDLLAHGPEGLDAVAQAALARLAPGLRSTDAR
jgi:formate dehydrogenase subunit delta